LLDLFAAALNAELEDAWRGLPTAPSQFTGPNGETPRPVQQALGFLPTPEALGEMKTGWPLLCVGRAATPATYSDFTLEQRAVTQRWDVDYILCPLAIGSLLRSHDILPAVGDIIDLVVKERGHRAYRTAQNGNFVYAADVLGSG